MILVVEPAAKSVPYLSKYLIENNINSLILSSKIKTSIESNEVVNKYNPILGNPFPIKFSKKSRFSSVLRSYLFNLSDNKNTILHVHNLWNYIPFIVYKKYKKHDFKYIISIHWVFIFLVT